MRHLLPYSSVVVAVMLAAAPAHGQHVTYRVVQPAAPLLSPLLSGSLRTQMRKLGVLPTEPLVSAPLVSDSGSARIECPMPVMRPDSTYNGAALPGAPSAPPVRPAPSRRYEMPTLAPRCTNPLGVRH